ncbi:hypothetical protein HYT18_04240 [Candidatus Microgenomates bacterium]|nr:hypothetical protein [Candidatus Microgenomates bacterium]
MRERSSFFSESIVRFVSRGFGAGLMFGYDSWRISYRKALVDAQGPLHPDSLSYKLLSNTGDLFNGYMNSYLIYFGLGLIAPRLSERIRAGIGFFAGAGSVMVAEIGIPLHLDFMGKPDINDIPAGIAGAGLFLLFNYGGRKIAERFIQRQVNKGGSE